MNFSRIIWKLKEKLIDFVFQKVRICFYSFVSNIKIRAKKRQPVLANGEGKIIIGKNVSFGVIYSPGYYTNYTYFNARKRNSYIEIGDNCWINNNAVIIADNKKIIIGNNCLIGVGLEITNSDFHDLNPNSRLGGSNIIEKDVVIGNNVFIGNNVSIIRGVEIGDNCVIGNRSVVTKSIPANVIAGGNPAKVLKDVPR